MIGWINRRVEGDQDSVGDERGGQHGMAHPIPGGSHSQSQEEPGCQADCQLQLSPFRMTAQILVTGGIRQKMIDADQVSGQFDQDGRGASEEGDTCLPLLDALDPLEDGPGNARIRGIRGHDLGDVAVILKFHEGRFGARLG